MPSQQQVKWSQLRVGLTVLVGSLTLAVLIFVMSGTVSPFSHKIVLRSYFENAAGLVKGAPVRLSGVDIGNVDRSDRPAASSEPDRVGALATTDVERPARCEVGDLGDEPPVRPATPHRPVALAVPGVPLGGLRRRGEPLLGVLVHVRDSNARRATPG